MTAKAEAKVSHRFSAEAERIYDAWLNPELVRLWMAVALRSFGLTGEMKRIEIDPRVGGKFFFSDMRQGAEAKHWGTYLDLERPNRIVHTWITEESANDDPSVVTLTFRPDPDGCEVAIAHEMDPKWGEYVARTEDGWARTLQSIEDLLTGTPDSGCACGKAHD
jgi:uncharacterized protein YndB with AHSA1/START domain